MPTAVKNEHWYATRLAIDWSPKKQRCVDEAGIRVFRVTPAAKTGWKERGERVPFLSYPDDQAEVVLELPAETEHHAAAIVMNTLGVGIEDFIVRPTWCPAAGR